MEVWYHLYRTPILRLSSVIDNFWFLHPWLSQQKILERDWCGHVLHYCEVLYHHIPPSFSRCCEVDVKSSQNSGAKVEEDKNITPAKKTSKQLFWIVIKEQHLHASLNSPAANFRNNMTDPPTEGSLFHIIYLIFITEAA